MNIQDSIGGDIETEAGLIKNHRCCENCYIDVDKERNYHRRHLVPVTSRLVSAKTHSNYAYSGGLPATGIQGAIQRWLRRANWVYKDFKRLTNETERWKSINFNCSIVGRESCLEWSRAEFCISRQESPEIMRTQGKLHTIQSDP